MKDQELLELAAKAIGLYEDWPEPDYSVQWVDNGLWCSGMGEGELWSPLEDDGDALRLGVKLGMNVHVVINDGTFVSRYESEPVIAEKRSSDPYAATRRAIVRAAAAIGKEMP